MSLKYAEDDFILTKSSKCFKSASTPNVTQDIPKAPTSILSMPHELLLEIPKYLGPTISLPAERLHWMSRRWGGCLPYPVYGIRARALRSLSQTSHSLRLFFLPLVWENFDACCAKDDNYGLGSADTQLTAIYLMLKLRSEGLIRHRDLGAFVRVANIRITRLSAEDLSTFAECLNSLPNLHTLQIVDMQTKLSTQVKAAFKGRRLLQIRTVILPNHAHHLLRSCPEVKEVTCPDYRATYIVTAITDKCRKVEALDLMISYAGDDMISHLIKATPNLRRVTIRTGYNMPFDLKWIRLLASLPCLHTIIFREQRELWDVSFHSDDVEARLRPRLDEAVNALQNTQGGDEKGRKWVRVWHRTVLRSIQRNGDEQVWTKEIEVVPK